MNVHPEYRGSPLVFPLLGSTEDTLEYGTQTLRQERIQWAFGLLVLMPMSNRECFGCFLQRNLQKCSLCSSLLLGLETA